MYGTDTGSDALYAEVGAYRLVMPAGSVEGVDLEEEATSVDAFEAFGAPAEEGRRRRIRLRGRGSFDLLVGRTLRVVRLADENLYPLPPFLSGMQGRLGVVGLALIEGSYALYVDPSALEPG